MRRKITVYGLRLSKTTFWNRINTGFSDPAVATVLTACGIETWHPSLAFQFKCKWLQQYLPLAVLKLFRLVLMVRLWQVATVLTACGIETFYRCNPGITESLPVATVLTACGIETHLSSIRKDLQNEVATVLTACGIETSISFSTTLTHKLQQYLPLAVLKRNTLTIEICSINNVATVLTACGIET